MKTATLALVAIAALATSSIACSSSSNGDAQEVDTGSALSALRSPTGSFSPQTAGKAFGGYRGTRADSSKVTVPGGTSTGTGGVKTGSAGGIKLLNEATSSAACTQGEACACPNGGTMAYRAESSSEGQLVKVDFNACGFEDGFSFDGKAFVLASSKSLLGLASSSPSSGTSGSQPVALLIGAKGTAANGTQKLPLEFALLTEAQYAFLAVSVPDGKIVIGMSNDGRAIVKSKEGTWTCRTSSSRGWSCTSESGQSMEVAEEEAPEGASATAENDLEG